MKRQHKHAPHVETCRCGASRTDGGEWSEGPQPAGLALVERYLALSTPEERPEPSRKASRKRWAGKTRKRDAYMREIARRPRPNARIRERCPCGKYSKWLAEKRGHKCSASNQLPS